MTDKVRVAVLMSTYNGQKYIQDQIDSILQQCGVDVMLYIRDDKSTDNTINVINQYKKNPKVRIVKTEGNLGYKNSFLTLVQYALNDGECEFDYLSFSDQDDVWKRDKLLRAVSELEKEKDASNKLYYSGLSMTDENLRVYEEKRYNQLKNTLAESFVRFSISGTTIVFSHHLAEKLMESQNVFLLRDGHDAILYRLNLALNGRVVCDDYSGVLFRRHSTNASSGGKNVITKIRSEFSHKYLHAVKEHAQFFLDHYEKDIDKEQLKIIKNVANAQKLTNKLQLIVNSKLRRESILMNMIFRVKVLTGFL